MSVKRFRTAQSDAATGFEVAISELQRGKKTSRWIWYIFPQLRGLGCSPMAQFYAIEGIQEARDYLRDPLLRERLLLAMRATAEQLSSGARLDELMGGSIASLKLVSSMTLFCEAAERAEQMSDVPDLASVHQLTAGILWAADAQGYSECQQTLESCRESSRA